MERPPRDENNIEDNRERCDQSRSRIARRALDEFFFPLFVNEREEVPERCPFKRSRDAYREIESMKMSKFNKGRKEDEWKDVSSGKVFKSEAEIDAYLTGRFLNEKKKAGGDVCLADYCDVLRCDEYSESLETSSASPTKREKKDSAAAKTRAGAHCYALTKICFPERSESAVQAKNSRRWFESVFCDTIVGLRKDGRNAFSHIRKQEFRYPTVSGQRQQHQHRGRVGNANTYDNASATSSSSSSSSSFLVISTLFVFLGFIFYLLFVLAPSMNRRASSDLNARKGRRSASKKKSMKDVAFEFCNRALVLSGFKPKKKRY